MLRSSAWKGWLRRTTLRLGRVFGLTFFSAILLHGQASYDILITGAKIIDGSGNPSFQGDIAIRGDTIAAVGWIQNATASAVLDARGLVVAPGFIDIHSHAERTILDLPLAENYLRQGVTTIIGGPDGGSHVPLAPFLDLLSETAIGVNFGSFVGHGSIREEAMGLVNRPATPEELSKMRAMTAQAMHDGAFGLSTGLFYVPGNYAATEEVIELARVAGVMGGMHISHMRDEAFRIEESVRETIRIGEEGSLPTQITHHKTVGKDSWGKSRETLRLVEEARATGVDVTIDQYPYTASQTGLTALFPQWSLEGGRSSLLERLSAPESRNQIKAEIVRSLRLERGAGDAKNVVLVNCDFDSGLAGKNLADLTRSRDVAVTLENAADTAIEIIEKGTCAAVYHAISEEDVERIMRSPYTMIASDGGIPQLGSGSPHPRNYGTFARVLGVYVRERKVIPIEEAVRKMAAFPAQRLKLWDRGLLRPGMKADVVVLDPDRVKDMATFEQPHQYSTGVRDVIVNGKIVMRDSTLTEVRSGRVLYGPAYSPSRSR